MIAIKLNLACDCQQKLPGHLLNLAEECLIKINRKNALETAHILEKFFSI